MHCLTINGEAGSGAASASAANVARKITLSCIFSKIGKAGLQVFFGGFEEMEDVGDEKLSSRNTKCLYIPFVVSLLLVTYVNEFNAGRLLTNGRR
jgi:hypothetical protein